MTKAEQVIELIKTQGLSRNKACEKVGIATSTFEDHIEAEGLGDQYARARANRAGQIFDELIEIADEPQGHVIDEDGNTRLDSGWQQHKKQRIDTRKWVLARMEPKKYGDRIEQVITSGKDLPPWITQEPK